MARATNRRGESAELADIREIPLEQLGGTEVVISDRSFIVGKLGLNHLTALARIVMNAVARMDQDKRRELQGIYEAAKAADEAENEEEKQRLMREAGLLTASGNIEVVVALLDADSLTRAAGVLLDVNYEWAKQHVDVLALLDIITALVDNNDIERVVATFLTLLERLQSLRALISKKAS